MDWITCPSCGLKHSPRPDGLCPRCRTRTVEPSAAGAQPPLATQPWPPAPPPLEPPPLDPGGAQPLPTTPWGAGAPPAAAGTRGPEVTVGSIVNKTFSIWWANFGKFFGTLALAYLPLLLVGAGAGAYGAARKGAGGSDMSLVFVPLIALCVVAFLVLALAQFGGVTYATLQHLAGKRTTVGAMFGVGFRRAWALFLVGMAASLLVMLGLVALVVPGIILGLGLSVTYAVVVAEKIGTVDAIKRSFALTKGKRGTILGALFVVMCAMWMASLAGNLATAAAASNQVLALVGIALSLVAQLALTPLSTVALAVAYHDLRVAKEGVDTSQLASVFE